MDGELLCFPVSGAEVDTVGNNHRRFWKTLPHSLTGGMSYNYFPRGRVELRYGKALVYLHPTLCTPGIYARIRHAFSLPEADATVAQGGRKPALSQYSEGTGGMSIGHTARENLLLYGHRPQFFPWGSNTGDPAAAKMLRALESEILQAIADSYTTFLYGGALGVDAWAAGDCAAAA